MHTDEQNDTAPDPRHKAAAKRMLAALDRLILAARQAERARDELLRGREDTPEREVAAR